MFFLVKSAFWIAVIIMLIPSDPAKQAQMYQTASYAVHRAVTFCDRNASVCENADRVWGIFKEKAGVAARMAGDLVSERLSGPPAADAPPAPPRRAGTPALEHRLQPASDTLRPADADDIDDAADVERYRDSVREYVVSFEAAEREARRRRDSGFTAAEQASLSRARKLVATAEDGGATPAERQTAYKKLRDELRGIIDVPSAAGERIERSIAQALERGRD